MTEQRIVITNASPIIHLGRIQRLELLTEIYDKIYCSPIVQHEVKYPSDSVDFINNHVEVQEVQAQSLVIEIKKKHPTLKLGEIETYALCVELSAEEALFLNNQAENIFRHEYAGRVRDLIDLPYADILKKVFQTEELHDQFYIQLDTILPQYKRLQAILKQRGLK